MGERPRFITYPIPTQGELFKPSDKDLEGGILKSIREKGTPLVVAGSWKLIGVPAHGPHHPDGHTVGWVCNYDSHEEILPWNKTTWENIPEKFLVAVEKYITEKQSANHQLRAYFYYGFVPDAIRQKLDKNTPVYLRGLQSQMRMHIHFVEPIPEHTHHRVLELGCPRDEIAMETILNESAIRAINDHNHVFRSYGITTPREIRPRMVNGVILHRTFYGFDSLSDTFRYTLRLFEELRPGWLEYAQTLGQAKIPLSVPQLYARQCAVPSGGILFPSYQDRGYFDLTSQLVYSSPLSIGGFIQVLEGSGFEHLRNEQQH